MNNMITATYAGIPGAFSEQALLDYFSEPLNIINVKTFTAAFKLLADKKTDYIIVPIENSSTGGIFEVFNALSHYDCFITGETYLRISHHLLGCQNASLDTIKTVYSHSQGFQQSSNFLEKYPHWVHIPYFNTAISAAQIAEDQDPLKAAIAGKRAADIYNLKFLAKNIQDANDNFTRFIIITNEETVLPEHNKISLIFSLPHSVGTLYQSLGIFAMHKINLLNLHSHPIINRPWQAYFYLDISGNLEDDTVKQALKELHQQSNFFRIMGSYTANDNTI